MFGDETAKTTIKNNMTSRVAISDLTRNPYQPRESFNEEKLNELSNSIKKNGIIAGIHYPLPNHNQKPYKKFVTSKLPITDKISKEIVSLPNFPLLTNKEVDKIIDIVNRY